MPYCIYCGKQYKEADSFCINCGKALPASANLTIQPLKPAGSSEGSPRKVRAIIFSVTALFIAIGVFSIFAGRNKEPIKKSLRDDEDRTRYGSEDIVTDDTATYLIPMDTLQEAYEEPVAPVETVPDQSISVAPDTLTIPMPKPSPSYIDPSTRELQYLSPCYVIVTGFYKDHNMARNEAMRLTGNGYRAAYLHLSNFPVFKFQNYYATVIGPYETSPECWDGLRSLQRIGPHWYGVKLTYDRYDRVELKP